MGYEKHFSDLLLATLYSVNIVLIICFVKLPLLSNSVIKMSEKLLEQKTYSNFVQTLKHDTDEWDAGNCLQ
jgi:hypothetical protein